MRTTRFHLPALILATALAAFGTTGCAAVDDDDWSEEDGEAGAPAQMELWSTNGSWSFHLVAGNGNVLMTSETYSTRMAALNGVMSVLDNGAYTSRYTAVRGSNGKYHLVLKAPNGAIIATTQQYATKSSATRAIGSCTRGVSSYLASVESRTGAQAKVLASETGWRFNVYAPTDKIVLVSEQYTTEAAAWNGAYAAVEAGALASRYEIRQASTTQFYFVLKGANGEIVGVSQMYPTRDTAETGKADMMALFPTISIL